MQLITTRKKEISFVELKKAISSGNGLELIRPGDKFAIELKNGEHVNAVCGGYVNEKRARFVLEDCLCASITKTWEEIEDAVATAFARLAGRFTRRGVSECRKSASIIARSA